MKTGIKIVAVPQPETFAEALGIGAVRERQICDMIKTCDDVAQTDEEAVVLISHMTKNINELAYAIFLYGVSVGGGYEKNRIGKQLDDAA